MPIIATIVECRKCGFEIRTDWKFCPNCGDKIACSDKHKELHAKK